MIKKGFHSKYPKMRLLLCGAGDREMHDEASGTKVLFQTWKETN